jgi:hypothetical protein
MILENESHLLKSSEIAVFNHIGRFFSMSVSSNDGGSRSSQTVGLAALKFCIESQYRKCPYAQANVIYRQCNNLQT